MQKWEYKIITCKRNIGFFSDYKWDKDMPSLLPALGEEGWELVNVVAECSAWGENNSGATTEEKWIFKRLKS
ncbi:DUF4177 domain-containing protein [Clostridium fungisolvens]|uniref:DUF4177 domain-containing protein n=1 Tax=Clostridium fungisolvens TaxID=1604897 RepID=A0A6V8SGD9_9CLOT|nr:DUF4177 domain-containing protein [Clostridium fungisolvens]GFP76279.1 hypothetical protein bsdtw1_02381 [Clostridium fungisolvens]